jgi:hypothetical protein
MSRIIGRTWQPRMSASTMSTLNDGDQTSPRPSSFRVVPPVGSGLSCALCVPCVLATDLSFCIRLIYPASSRVFCLYFTSEYFRVRSSSPMPMPWSFLSPNLPNVAMHQPNSTFNNKYRWLPVFWNLILSKPHLIIRWFRSDWQLSPTRDVGNSTLQGVF